MTVGSLVENCFYVFLTLKKFVMAPFFGFFLFGDDCAVACVPVLVGRFRVLLGELVVAVVEASVEAKKE